MTNDPRHSLSTFPVNFHQVGDDGRAHITTIANQLQLAAQTHAQALGVANDSRGGRGFGWILTRQAIRLDQWPVNGDTITVETWPSAGSRRLFTREYELFNSAGSRIGVATSAWAVWDLAKRKIAALPPDLLDRWELDPRKALQPAERTIPKLAAPDKECAIIARYSDHDINGHVNNAILFGWVIEPVLMGAQGRLSGIDIMFRNESKAGDAITSRAQAQADGSYLHQLVRTHDDTELARARTLWTG